MTEQAYKLKENQRVKLKSDGQDRLYLHACAGSVGRIKAHKRDKHGYAMVFVEWDKDHWTFNGEPDGWTFEDHFESMEDAMPDNDSLEDEVKAFLKWRQEREEKAEDITEPDTDSLYREELDQAYETAKSANAFMLVSISNIPESPGVSFDPRIFHFYKDQSSGLILETQISSIAARAHQLLAIEDVQRRQGQE